MPVSGDCEITMLLRDGLALVTCRGELDLLALRDLERTLEDVAATAPRTIHLDLSHVSFLASSGIGLLVRRAWAIKHLGIRCKILVSDAVHQILDVAGAADALPLKLVPTSLPTAATHRTTIRLDAVRAEREDADAHRSTIDVPDLAAAT